MKLNVTVPLPTSINKLYINQYQYNPMSKKREPTGKRILSSEGRKVKAKIMGDARVQLEQQEWDYDWTKENYLYQDAVIYFTRRGSDDNNVYKLLNDSLEGILYDNDSRVLVRTQRIVYDASNPRIELTLTPVEFIGIFENKNALDSFESICQSCSKYRKGSCSILKDSVKGNVRSEDIGTIYMPSCNKYKKKNN